MVFKRLFGKRSVEVGGASEQHASAWPPASLTELVARESGAEVRPFFTQDFGRQRDERGISVKVDDQEALPVVERLRSQVGPGVLVWHGTRRDLSSDPQPGVEIVVAPGSSNAEAIMLANVDPVNYGMTSMDVAVWVENRDHKLGLELLVADTESLVLRITEPFDALELANEVNAFCPDIMQMMFASIEDFAADLAEKKIIDCWWD